MMQLDLRALMTRKIKYTCMRVDMKPRMRCSGFARKSEDEDGGYDGDDDDDDDKNMEEDKDDDEDETLTFARNLR